MDIIEELKHINKDHSYVSYDFNSFYPSAQIDLISTWAKIETAYSFKKCMSDAVCSLFNSGTWNEINRSAFLMVKCHNAENIIFL